MTALTWVAATHGTQPPEHVYCQTRDIAQARVETVRSELLAFGWDASISGSGRGSGNSTDAAFHIIDGQPPVRGVVASLELQRL